MKKIGSAVAAIVARAVAYARRLWQREPARVVTVVAAAVVFAAAKVGIVVDQQSVTSALAILLPILLGGEVIRRKVTPAAKE